MRSTAWPVLLLLTASAAAGCTDATSTECTAPADAPGVPQGTVDAITPGTWCVTGPTDRMLVWAHNDGTDTVNVTWSLTAADGGPLPQGWSVAFEPATATLQPNGTKTTQAGRSMYPDWAWSVATLTLPEGAAEDTQTLRLHAGPLNATLAVEVAGGVDGTVTEPGDFVKVQYRGTFSESGQEFDSGDFGTTLGDGRTVTGFGYGLMGLEVDESASLVVPPALAYGYDNPRGQYERFNGQWLTFDVTLQSIA